VSAANAEKGGVWGGGKGIQTGQLSTGGFRARGLEKIKEGLGKMLHCSKSLILNQKNDVFLIVVPVL